jgi:hemoglobin/transferrin/lactoferrin receptor protein
MIKSSYLWLGLCGVVCNQVLAQTATYSTDSVSLHELVVTASRTETSSFNTSEAIQAIPSGNIRRLRPRSTPELLQHLPGVFLQKTNHGGGSPFIRGLTGNQTLLLLDGIRLNNATYRYGPNQYLNTVDVFSLEKVEVLRGSGAVQYGSDAMGGTIQVFSRQAPFSSKNKWRAGITGRLWSQKMEQSVRASIGYSTSKWAVTGGYTYRHFGDLVGGDTTGVQHPSGYSEQAFDVKSRVKLTQQTILTIAHNEVQQSVVPVFHKVQLENFSTNVFDPQLRRLTYARLDGKTTGKWLRQWYVVASRQQTTEGRISQKKGASIQRNERDAVLSHGFTSNVTSVWNKVWSANSGIEVYHDAVSSSSYDKNTSDGSQVQKRGLYPDASTLLNVAAFSLHSFDFKPWTITAGLRMNGYHIHMTDNNLGKVTLTPEALVWNGALQRQLGKHVKVSASYHTGFRAPNIDDLGTLGIVDFRYEIPNFNLKPEKSHQYQIGLKLQHDHLHSETYLFRNNLRDLIARIKTTDSIQGYPVYRKENIEEAYIQGLETQWVWQVIHHFSLEGHLTYTFGQNITKAEPMRRIPPLNTRLAIRWDPGQHWQLSAEWCSAAAQTRLAQGDRDDIRIPTGGTPKWSVFHVACGYNWQKLHVQLSLYNLLNRDYRLHGSGVNAVGRSLLLTLEYELFQ